MKFGIGNKIGRRFSSNRQPRNKGRKLSLYKQFAKQTELSREDFICVLRYLLERTPNELDSLTKDLDGHANKDTPIWVINLISAIKKDVKRGQISTLNILFNFLFGKPRASVQLSDIETKHENFEFDYSSFSEDEMKQLENLMLKVKVKNCNNSNENINCKIYD